MHILQLDFKKFIFTYLLLFLIIMDNMQIKADHLTQCGRIYLFLSHGNSTFFVINCLFCNKDFSEWLTFYDHLGHVHQLESIQMKPLNKRSNQVEELNFKNDLSMEKVQSEQYYTNTEYLDENDCISEKNSHQSLNNHTEILDECSNNDFDEYKSILIPYNEEKSLKSTSSCFFRLHGTEPEIMLKFIELLRQHPFQWNHQYNFNPKEKRFDSTSNLTKQLNENLNISISPRGTRASVLSLLRWFDREYIRYLNCQQYNYHFACMYRAYFDKLLEFLPHKHIKPMTCDECSKFFKSKHLLMAHRHKYHNGQVPFRCRYCGHGFIHQSSHKMHENRHIKIHVWPCKICRYQATSKSDFIKHLSTHSSNQPYKCSICGLAYKTKTNLNVHLKSHSLPKYECEICKKKFYEKYRYKRHIWQHENHDPRGKSIDNFTCEICGRRFTNNKNLIKHQVVHIQENYKIENEISNFYKLTDVNVYFCGYCSLEFIYKDAYETHMNLKHDTSAS